MTSNYEAGGLLGDEAGGLAGSNDGLIIASYASGDVTGGSENASGAVWNGATVDARRSANPAATGGLVGRQFGRNYIVASYWDTQTSGRATGVGKGDDPGAEGKTTAELQAPTGYTGIYAGWNVDLDNADGDDDPATGPDDWWDFRSGSRYPVLKLDPDSRPSANGTYDTDGDGLIEVSTLEQLDVIRWSKDSPGEAVGGWGNNRSAAAAFPTGGEVCNVCYGYELVRSLDFQDAGSYASGEVNTAWIRGEGWDPEDFDGTLYGNGHTISNLYINRPDKSNVGFFGEVEGTVRNIGLIDVDVTGNKRVGGLAGTNDGLRLGYKREGNIIASYATGSVTGNEGVGGLVGANYESGVIIASYADASVSGKDYVAGLVGRNYESSSYATGSVTGNEGVGGLVG